MRTLAKLSRRIRCLVRPLLAALLAVTACGASSTSSAADDGPIKIGYIASLTGVAANDARQDITGAKFAVDDINKSGGVLGRRLELIVRDDQTNPVTASNVARTLGVAERVQFLAGGQVSSAARSVSQASKELKIPYVISTATATNLTEEDGHRYVFRSWANARSQVGPVASYAAKQNWKRYAIIYADYSMGMQVAASFKEFVKRGNPQAQFVIEVPAKLGEVEFTPHINQVLASKPEAVYLGGIYGSSLIAFAKQAAAAGLFDTAPVISFVGAADLEAFGKSVPDGRMIGYNSFYASIPDPWVKNFSERFRNETRSTADGSAFTGYMTIKWIEAGLKKAGKVDAEAFVNAMEGLSLDTFLGKVTMRKADHQATGDYWYGVVKQASPSSVMTDLGHVSGASYLLPESDIPQKRKD
jgi:branched-chain amino acid transport system substrate-binding protein